MAGRLSTKKIALTNKRTNQRWRDRDRANSRGQVNLGNESLHERLKEFASPRRRFGYRMLHIRNVIDNWREAYNHSQSHSTLGYLPPASFVAQSDDAIRLMTIEPTVDASSKLSQVSR